MSNVHKNLQHVILWLPLFDITKYVVDGVTSLNIMMHDNDLCHARCPNGSRLSSYIPYAQVYGPVQMSGLYNECLTRGNLLSHYHIQSNE
jgi:hypothetical protein